MKHQYANFFCHGAAKRFGVAARHDGRDSNVAEEGTVQRFYAPLKARGTASNFGGKRKNVRGARFLSKGLIEARHFGIADEANESGVRAEAELTVHTEQEALQHCYIQEHTALVM